MERKGLKQLSQELINGTGKEKLSTLTKEERAELLDILKERYHKSVADLLETMEEARQELKATRSEIAKTRKEIARAEVAGLLYNNTFPAIGEA